MEIDEACRTPLTSVGVGEKKSLSASHFKDCGRKWPRIVRRSGKYNVTSVSSMSSQSHCHTLHRLLIDSFGTLVDARWRYVIALFSGSFVVSWIFFALIWWGVVIAHGDDIHGGGNVGQNTGNESAGEPWRPCISNVYDFNAALMFSVDLQTTNGFGFGEIETTCPAAMFLFMFQCAIGGLIEVASVGVLFAKLVRPKRRPRTVMFSRHAVVRHLSIFADTNSVSRDINQDGGCLVLQFRVADIRQMAARLMSVSISAYVFLMDSSAGASVDDDGEQVFPVCRRSLPLSSGRDTSPSCSVNLLLLLPETLTHRVNVDSPLYDKLVRGDYIDERGHARGHTPFEIVVVLEGVDSATGRQMQARTSYALDDLVWNHRLQPLTSRVTSGGRFVVDFTNFDGTVDDANFN